MMTDEQLARLLHDIDLATEPPRWLTWLFYLTLIASGIGAGLLWVSRRKEDSN